MVYKKKHSYTPKLVIVRSSNTFFGCGCSFSRAIWSVSHFSRCRPTALPSRNVLHPLMRGHETNMAAVHGNKHGRDAQRRITHNDYPMQRDRWCWTSARGCLRSGSSACGRGNSSCQLCVPLPSQGVLFLFSVWMGSPNPNGRVRFELFGLKCIPTQLAKLSSDEVSVIDETSSVVDLNKAKKIETDANPSQYSVFFP